MSSKNVEKKSGKRFSERLAGETQSSALHRYLDQNYSFIQCLKQNTLDYIIRSFKSQNPKTKPSKLSVVHGRSQMGVKSLWS